jgi:hypothetical protein
MRSCSNFFDKDWHLDACICLWQLTGDLLLSLVSSIRVARLLVHSVLLGSLAKLSFSSGMRSVLAFLQMVDAITGKVMSSMFITLAFKVHCDTSLFHGLVPRTRSCSGLLSLLYSTASGSDYELLLSESCCTQPHQVLTRTFCYQSLVILDHSRFQREPSVIKVV